jgi:hypothetical protein
MAQLEALQTERKQAAAEAMEQAKLLYRFAQAQGKPYRPAAFFIGAPEVKESVYSSAEVARKVSRARLFSDAENYVYLGRRPKKKSPNSPWRPLPLVKVPSPDGEEVAARLEMSFRDDTFVSLAKFSDCAEP